MHSRLVGAAAWGGGTHANDGVAPRLHVSLASPMEGLISGCLRDSLWALPIQ